MFLKALYSYIMTYNIYELEFAGRGERIFVEILECPYHKQGLINELIEVKILSFSVIYRNNNNGGHWMSKSKVHIEIN